MMPNQACERLQQNIDHIMNLWEQRSRHEVAAASQQGSLILRDALPQYLTLLVSELSIQSNQTDARSATNEVAGTRICKSHGQERAACVDYSISQLILEYHILRQVIFAVLEADVPLSVRDRDVIISSIEQAVNDAATQFSATLRNAQAFMQTLTHDLRGSISVVNVGAQLILLRHERGDRPHEVVATMLNAASRMNSMIEDLLDVSRLRAGHHLTMKLEDCDLHLLLKDVVSDLSFVYGKRFVVASCAACPCYCSPPRTAASD